MEPIIIIPGHLCTSELFTYQIPNLWKHGSVTIPSILEGSSLTEMAKDIIQKAPPYFSLAGMSMGGFICLEIMKLAPERVSRLALLNSSARPETEEQKEMRENLLNKTTLENFEEILKDMATAGVHKSRQHDKNLINTIIRMGKETGFDAYVRQSKALGNRTDNRNILTHISVPTLVLVGDSDTITPPEHSEEMAEKIPNAKLIKLYLCGHATTLEQPEEVNKALIEWLNMN
ncbi:alpha/beta fold hydrolase [Photorhabdus aegyptia]|uniref:Putative hydrolase or acyltransferase of alpha/beta superfamily n=1 Tax=Photorhabdus aegyptia TaxID=2805098 RepID=A0A022PJ81_9GAMM|nr:alpha/beta hydrolase [Photorhabdus aegyptia]EYU15721.1 putative hydrolase or acyltransferase of alpha/beta superfamily [Photorhabdus aegyptia]